MHKTRYTTFPEGGKCTLLPMPAAGMGKRGALAPSGNVVACFCALVVTAVWAPLLISVVCLDYFNGFYVLAL